MRKVDVTVRAPVKEVVPCRTGGILTSFVSFCNAPLIISYVGI